MSALSRAALGVMAAVIIHASVHAADADLALERARMIPTIESHASMAHAALGRDRLSPDVLNVMRAVPRHEFVPDGLRADAYGDRPLPIGYGQTISQPFIVALMTDLLHAGRDDIVLEVGTGSGYQAAVLSPLVRRVYTIEIVPGLADSATARLRRLGYSNVETRTGDGYYGWEEAAPFDGILVTAAASQIPPPLVKQLKPGSRMIIPVGAPFALQHLVLVERGKDGRVTTRQLLPVSFVPLTGGGRR